MDSAVSLEHLEALRKLDSCTLANVIETFDVRLRNEGFADSRIRCLFEQLPPMVGYAVTARIRCSNPPPVGFSYFDRTDWWDQIRQIPEPRIFVVQDMDGRPGLGALLGEVHTTILKALGCLGAVTNGAVRDLPAIEAAQFPLFAGNVAVSHAYAHFIDFGTPVVIAGLKINPGDLLHGDRHGLLSIPHRIAADIPAVAARMIEQEEKIIALCHSTDFSLEKLREAVAGYLAVSPHRRDILMTKDKTH
jgi:regulator of RNase E activity RraA